MTYGKKVMVIGGVRVTDAPDPRSTCRGCVFDGDKGCSFDAGETNIEIDVFGGKCWQRLVVYIPAPDDLKEEA